MDELIAMYIRSMKLAPAMNVRRIYAAWDEVSGAAPFTLRRYFRSGTLYITVSSSMVRNQLSFQRDILVEKINARLAGDSMFAGGDRTVGYVEKLILR